ncbi:MAG TPA: alcohol dehydrogenase catalytic domain-containing protein, partial [Roseiflexaceae bacterium]
MVDQVADPACRPVEVVVQVAAAGICGTDLHIYRNEYMSDFPHLPARLDDHRQLRALLHLP